MSDDASHRAGSTGNAGIALQEARAPDGMRLYAIGDIHGRLDLLEELHGLIRAELARDAPADWRIVHLGDYVDRGPNARGVIDFLQAAAARDPRVLCLIGNHDLGFLDFLAEPDAGGLFAQYGGVQTALSYGVPLDFSGWDALRRSWAALNAAVPAGHRAFLSSLKGCVSFGDFFFCHAGIRAGVPLDRQEIEDLVWIRNGFLDRTGLHPKVVVHGHTISAAPDIQRNRVGIDTGAFHSGVLTAFIAEGPRKRFLATGA